jgi:hypothetical protein
MERVWVTRLRWRMRGAWLWPCFLALTLADGFVLHHLPPYGEGPGTVVAGVLLAGFLNLFVIAVLAPLARRPLRRRRPDLPRMIADNYAGTMLVSVVALALLVAGLAHRPAVVGAREDEAAALASFAAYVRSEGDADHRSMLAGGVDQVRIKEDVFRSCVPRPEPRRWFCVFVDTGQRPAGITADPEQVGNDAYRGPGGFR